MGRKKLRGDKSREPIFPDLSFSLYLKGADLSYFSDHLSHSKTYYKYTLVLLIAVGSTIWKEVK